MNTIVIDNGYFSTIGYNPSKIFSIRSKYQSSDFPISFNNTYHITFDKSYLIGEGAEQIDINLNKSNSKLHLLTTLTILGLFNCSTYNLVVNIPLNFYNKQNKQNIESQLTSKVFQFSLNSQSKNIYIDQCVAFPQSLPIIYCNKIDFSHVAIVDIGGLTAQGCIVENNNLVFSSIFTDNLGTLILYEKIKKVLNSQYNINMKDYEMQDIISNGLLFDKSNSLKLIDSICLSHVQEIVTKIKLTGWNVDNLFFIFTGGGSILLEKYINNFFKNYHLSNNPEKDNVFGLWEVAKHVYKV